MNRKELLQEYDRIVKKAKSQSSLANSVLPLFKDELYYLKNKDCPASTKYHHCNDLGLLEHTIEVCKILELLAKKYNLDEPLLLVAGLIHDLGKIHNYIKKNEGWVKSETNIDHSQYIYAILKNKNFSFLANIVGVHMGKKEWGAIQDIEKFENPGQKEAWALHLADMISAKLR